MSNNNPYENLFSGIFTDKADKVSAPVRLVNMAGEIFGEGASMLAETIRQVPQKARDAGAMIAKEFMPEL
jgi:hypothetical protein